jgi:Family of unknown function (DUF5681)
MSESTEAHDAPAESVGYKRPPANSRFVPGKSGNPRGRPKRKQVDMGRFLNKALNTNVVVKGLGKPMTGYDAVVQSIVHRVLQGESKAIPELLRLFNGAKLFKPLQDTRGQTGVMVIPPNDKFWERNDREKVQ